MGDEKKELLGELVKQFDRAKKELGFKASFEDLDNAFFITDSVLSAGFVSETYSRQLCARIVDNFMNWNHYLNSLLMPNPSFLVNAIEAKLFNTEENRKKIWELVKGSMKMTSTNYLLGLTKDKKKEAAFIDEAVKYWNSSFKQGLTEIVGKISEEWGK